MVKCLQRDIRRAIHNFENGNTDVLVATTIIENGIDIENANTMIIEGLKSQVYHRFINLEGKNRQKQ